MFPMLPPGRAPGPLRITVGILLMMLVAMWTFATPQARADETAAEVVIIETVSAPDTATDTAGEPVDHHDPRPQAPNPTGEPQASTVSLLAAPSPT